LTTDQLASVFSGTAQFKNNNINENNLSSHTISMTELSSKTQSHSEKKYQTSTEIKSQIKSKQDASAATYSSNDDSTINNSFYKKINNENSRRFLFSSMTGIDKKYWSKSIYYKTFQFMNLFVEMVADKRWLISVPTFIEKLPDMYDKVNPPISMLDRNNFFLYKFLPKEINLDLLCFLALENYSNKFDVHKMSNNELVNETILKIIMKDYGMGNIPDTVIDLAMKGYDSFRRRLYSPQDVIKYLIIVQAAAGENARNSEFLKIFNLKLNNQYERKFSNFPRKFMSSPLV
jgi:hypothetical protein